jgi:hypothetical protein
MNINCNLFRRVTAWLVLRALVTPYWHLPQYMERFWLVPFVPKSDEDRKHGCYVAEFRKNPVVWCLQKLGVSVRVHRILRSDEGDHFHDHPASFVSIIVRGRYAEVFPQWDQHGLYVGDSFKWRNEGDVYFRRFYDFHRVQLLPEEEGEPVVTIFIMFKWRQKWGYLMQPAYKRYYRDVYEEAAARLPEIK